ncbi:MAG: RdgB/HAM1 family non-canonical purine NTP pyrophosphatase [Clostridia bacterium]|nr:RdgB/HAM1 family non-canonical purine NTP pyrophosphatase [Clostridia bacterium]
MKIIIGSNNKKKLKELQALLGEYGVELVTPAMLGLTLEPEETGSTFEENSLIKASAFAKETGLPCIADDSGLEVKALGGRPGVYSARYAGELATDGEKMDKLLGELEGVTDRAARFVSVATYCAPDGTVIQARGECPGEILHEKRGTNGFGYDPVFFCTEAGECFGEVSPEEKAKYSHRGRSLALLKEKLRPILEDNNA